MQYQERTAELQNLYAVRVINMVLMGIEVSKSPYVDRFIYSLYNGVKSNWDEDCTWTEHFTEKLTEERESIKNGSYWKMGDFFRLIAAEDKEFWEAIGVPFKTWKSIQLCN